MHIGDMLLKSGHLSKKQLDSALEHQNSLGGQLGHIMVKLGFITEQALVQTLSEQLQVKAFDLWDFEPDPEMMKRLPQEVMERLNVIPLKEELGKLHVGISDPTDMQGIDELRMHAGENIETFMIAPAKAHEILNRFFHMTEEKPDSPDRATRRGRSGLQDLVHELERDAVMKQYSPVAGDSTFDNITTRNLVLGLIAALHKKGVIAAAEVADSVNALGGGNTKE